MAAFRKFEDIDAWQKARELANLIYSITDNEIFGNDFAMKNQIRRSALIAMTSIADGFCRDSNQEFGNCLGQAKGATAETRSLLYVSLDRHYISEENFLKASAFATDVERLASGLMKYLRSGLKS
ncbi:MAG: four helix bundle protein [Candidatus Sumerlaeia bacterium]